MQTVYLEKAIQSHPRTQRILQKLNPLQIIECDNYKEIFNLRMQNFRIQKQNPALILAEKKGNKVFPSPPNFGIGSSKNYYFSHMLNCLYDCRYCFLQGMYSSAYYVLFVNYEDFMQEIAQLASGSQDTSIQSSSIQTHSMQLSSTQEPIYFFSGYDCDSLAYEPVSHFIKEFLPFFRRYPNAILELRTKSTNIQTLLAEEPLPNCIVAFSFTPEPISQEIEHKVPPVSKRINAMMELAKKGWLLGLRLDPLIYHPEFKTIYKQLILNIFHSLPAEKFHSISVGPLRFPTKMYQKILKLYPDEPMLNQNLVQKNNLVSYSDEIEKQMKNYIYELLHEFVPKVKLFECQT